MNDKALDELAEWMGKHKLTVGDVVNIFASFMAYMAYESGNAADFIMRFTAAMIIHLKEKAPRNPQG